MSISHNANKDATLNNLETTVTVKHKHSKDVEEEERKKQEDAEPQSLQNVNKDATLSTSVIVKQQQ